MQNDFKFYQLSGRIGIMGIIVGLISGFFSAVILSWFYALIVLKLIDFIYVNFIVVAIFCAIVASSYESFEKKGRNRNVKVSIFATLLLAIITWYLAWVAFICVKSNVNYFDLVSNPIAVMKIITKMGSRDSIYALAIVAELLYFCFLFYSMAALDKNSVYCENCSRWLEQEILPARLDKSMLNEIKSTALSGEIRWIDKIQISSIQLPPYITLAVTYCDTCDNVNLLKAFHLHTVVQEGQARTEEEIIFQNLIVNKTVFETLLKNICEALEAHTEKEEENIYEEEQDTYEDESHWE